MYNAQWSAAQKLIKKWDGRFSKLPLKIFTLYNQEAHLDWQAKTLDERTERAKWHGKLCALTTSQEQIESVVVDNPDNKTNIAYGQNPNGITIIDPDGKIIYYRDWFRYGEVDKFFEDLFKKKTASQ
ncbi:MAG: hypothetical protein HYZ11_01690 [Candidatus Tectomicrobia bacterium]|uniref:Uncharacterized protein n=1 Tax=Tectimicrobiota bacterium TaxID=2528274 RepID=A0A932HXM9_UNCTE|nr:hypothetical protein [Candidatus Tectomicrobia bacterium]